jgi:hypothetical protein
VSARPVSCDVESQIATAEATLRRASLAETERERREQAAQAETDRAATAKLIAQADKLAARLPAVAKRIDTTAQSLAEAVKEHRETAQRVLALRIEAGVTSTSTTLGQPYDGAVRFAFSEVGVANALEPVPMGRGSIGPMQPVDR